MASGTNAIGSAVVGIEPRMVEGCPCPTACRMAECARRWEARGNMGRTVCLLIQHLVAAITIGGQGRVIVVYVTIRASDGGVSPRQWERSIVVVERRRRPRGGVVAHVTLLRKPHRYVIRIIRVLEICEVAAHASRIGQFVVPIQMTLTAL